jgi:8-oxo-dGTP diphosphatase
MRRWLVGGALIPHDGGLVLVGNRRRDGSYEWTPPGGVIDRGERLLAGLTREVREETGLEVRRWARRSYTVDVHAPEMGWVLRVEAWEAAEVTGAVRIDDPDGIVEEVRYVGHDEASGLLQASPPWVHVPVGEWLRHGRAVDRAFRFRLSGTDRATARVERES